MRRRAYIAASRGEVSSPHRTPPRPRNRAEKEDKPKKPHVDNGDANVTTDTIGTPCIERAKNTTDTTPTPQQAASPNRAAPHHANISINTAAPPCPRVQPAKADETPVKVTGIGKRAGAQRSADRIDQRKEKASDSLAKKRSNQSERDEDQNQGNGESPQDTRAEAPATGDENEGTTHEEKEPDAASL
jgi:hypothetical protein